MEQIRPRDLRAKKPWGYADPRGYRSAVTADDSVLYNNYTQADMLREYYPSAHTIMDPTRYKDIFIRERKKDPKSGKMGFQYYRRPVPRKAYAFQQMIATKRTMHLTGNDIMFEHVDASEDAATGLFRDFRSGWSHHDMDIQFSAAVLASMIVADAAIVFWMEKGRLKTRELSFFNGDTLYPHFEADGRTLKLFARSYSQFDEEGNEMADYMEIWTRPDASSPGYHYVYRRKGKKYQTAIERIKSSIVRMFNLNDYDCILEEPHGFKDVPVAYHRRDDGPCWVYAQKTIEDVEIAKSQMALNNEEYGEPTLVVALDEEVENAGTFVKRDGKGSVKEIQTFGNTDVKYLQSQSAADSYQKQIDDDIKLIYKQAFIVDTPELKSGDLPAAALKILYSLAYEKANEEAILYHPFLRQVVSLFVQGYAIETANSDFMSITDHIRFWIVPYVHESTSSMVADLVSGVNANIISRKSATEMLNGTYTSPGELDTIKKEQQQDDAADLLTQVRLLKAQANAQRQQQQQNSNE